jgi:hypothetical protein
VTTMGHPIRGEANHVLNVQATHTKWGAKGTVGYAEMHISELPGLRESSLQL